MALNAKINKTRGASVHSSMTPHEPDAEAFQKASDRSTPLKPVRMADQTMLRKTKQIT